MSFTAFVRVTAVALIVLFGFTIRLSHMLLVQHVICAHGDLVDQVETKAEPATRDVPDDRNAIDTENAAESEDHDHCDAMSVLHRDAGPHYVAPCKTLSFVVIVGERERAAVRSSKPIAYAPKGSPPNVSSAVLFG